MIVIVMKYGEQERKYMQNILRRVQNGVLKGVKGYDKTKPKKNM
jgi:hypothetical protein